MSSAIINRVVLVGHLTRDPELRTLPSGLSVCNLQISCNTVRRDTEGDFQEKSNYFDVSAFEGQAESIKRYMRKGNYVAVDGQLELREWETADQQKLQAVGVVADTVMFLDSPGGPGDETDQRSTSELVGITTGAEGDGLASNTRDPRPSHPRGTSLTQTSAPRQEHEPDRR
jgi:single-strand DNA-binding protein